MTSRWKDALAVAVIVAMLASICVIAAARLYVVQACVSRGWATGLITVNGSMYCVTRVNQSDVVKRLREAEPR